MTSSPPVSLAILGCGRIARTYMDAISLVPHIRLKSVYDPSTDVLKEAAEYCRCDAVSNLDAIFGDSVIDAVIICVPPAYHYELMKQAIQSGKHVLCEKPFTLALREALEIKSLADDSGRVVMMGSKFRFTPDMIETLKYIQSGVLGEIIMCEVVFCCFADMTRRWNSDRKISGGGVLIDNGSHAVDIIRYLAGPIAGVYAQQGKPIQQITVEDTVYLHFETETGIIGTANLSWSLNRYTDSYVNVMGTDGTIEVGWNRSTLWGSNTQSSRQFGTGYNKLDAFRAHIEHFAGCLRGQVTPILDIDDAVESVRVIETAYTSIRKHQWLRVA